LSQLRLWRFIHSQYDHAEPKYVFVLNISLFIEYLSIRYCAWEKDSQAALNCFL
jgi:hypothetical protein